MDKKFDPDHINRIFDTYFESSPDIFFLLDQEGLILEYKASKLSELYSSPEHFIGKRIENIMPSEISEKFLNKISEAKMCSETVSFFYELLMPSGLEYYDLKSHKNL